MNFEEPAKPLLTEPGVKYFLNQALKQSHIIRENFHNMVFNIGMFIFFLLILGGILVYKYKGRLTPVEIAQKNKEKHQYNIGKGWKMDQTKQPSKQLLLSTKKLKEEAKKINIEDMLNIIKIDFNPDLNVELMVNEIKQRVIALGWKLNNNYVLFGMRQGIKEYISKNTTLGFLSGKEAIKSQEDHYTLRDLFNKVEQKFNRPRLEMSYKVTPNQGQVMIGIPYEDRVNKDPKKLIELIYNIEKGLCAPIPETFFESLKKRDSVQTNNKDILEKETYEILTEERTEQIMEDERRTNEARQRTEAAIQEQNGICDNCGRALNDDGECMNNTGDCRIGARNVRRMREQEAEAMITRNNTVIMDDQIIPINGETYQAESHWATTPSITIQANTDGTTTYYHTGI